MRAGSVARRVRCSACGDEFAVRNDGTVRIHGHPRRCPGSLELPAEGCTVHHCDCGAVWHENIPEGGER